MWRAQNLKRWSRDQRGAAALEFAIVGPLLLSMLCGIIFYGLFLFKGNQVNVAARDAAQLAMMMPKPTDDDVKNEVKRIFAELGLEGSSVDVTIGQRDDGGREAIIVAGYEMKEVTALFDTQGMGHEIVLRVPLQD